MINRTLYLIVTFEIPQDLFATRYNHRYRGDYQAPTINRHQHHVRGE